MTSQSFECGEFVKFEVNAKVNIVTEGEIYFCWFERRLPIWEKAAPATSPNRLPPTASFLSRLLRFK